MLVVSRSLFVCITIVFQKNYYKPDYSANYADSSKRKITDAIQNISVNFSAAHT